LKATASKSPERFAFFKMEHSLDVDKNSSFLIFSDSNDKKAKRGKKRVNFKPKDETDERQIETRKELSQQDRCSRWYQGTDINAMKMEALSIVNTIKKCAGADSGKIQRILQLGSGSLRGLEISINDERQMNKYLARRKILNYHRAHKCDNIGLSLICCKEAADAKLIAWETAYDDAEEAKLDSLQYFKRLRDEISGGEDSTQSISARKRACISSE